jgi:hypothetical protein
MAGKRIGKICRNGQAKYAAAARSRSAARKNIATFQ